jgi:hypothetical protein
MSRKSLLSPFVGQSLPTESAGTREVGKEYVNVPPSSRFFSSAGRGNPESMVIKAL